MKARKQLWCLECHGTKPWGPGPSSFGTCTNCGRTGVSRREPRSARETTALPSHGPETSERRALRRILELAEAIDKAGKGGEENDEIMHTCTGLLGD